MLRTWENLTSLVVGRIGPSDFDYSDLVESDLLFASKRINTIKIRGCYRETFGMDYKYMPNLIAHAAPSLEHVALYWISARSLLALPPHLLTLHLEHRTNEDPAILPEGLRRIREQTLLTRLHLGREFSGYKEMIDDMTFLSGE